MDKQTRIITPEQFLKYKSITEFDVDFVEIYAMILWRDKGKSFDQYVQDRVYDNTEILFEQLKDEYEIDFHHITEEEFLSTIHEVYREQFKTIREHILSKINDNIELSEIADSSEMEELIDSIDKIKKEQIESVANILSGCDLSKIPSEMLNDITWTSKINFENTGANIDMNSWHRSACYNGSFKGCNLISFNHFRYRAEKNSRTWESFKSFPNDDELEPKQYQVVINSYRRYSHLPMECYRWFEEDENLLANNTWFIDECIKNPKTSGYVLNEIWLLLNDEYKKRYKQIFNLIVKKSQESGDSHYVYAALKVAQPELWRENFSKFEKIFADSKGEFDVITFLENVWEEAPKEIQEEYFDYYENHVKDIRQEKECLKILYGGLNPDLLSNKIPYLFNKYINSKDNKISKDNFEALSDILIKISPVVEFPEEVVNIIFNAYKNKGNILYRSRFDLIWGHVGKENQLKYMQELIESQLQTGVPVHEMSRIWDHINAEVRLEKFKDVTKFLKENESDEFIHYVQGEGYINILKELGEKGIEVVKSNMSQFIHSLREKYDCNSEDVDISKDSEYDVEFAKVLLELDQKNVLNNENLNTIIKAMPILGIELINRVYSSNSKMIANYGKQLIEKIVNLSREDASNVVDEVEHVFSQRHLPEFMKIYKYYELVHDIENGNITSRARMSEGRMSPVLENSPGENTAKRIIFSDLMKIAMDTNNKSMRDFLNVLSEGNSIHINLIEGGGDISQISNGEYQMLQNYVKTAYSLYENSGVASVDKSKGKKIFLTGDIIQDLEVLSKRYDNGQNIANLPDLVLKTYIGPYEELYGGITTVKQMQEYMNSRVKESNSYHRQLAKRPVELVPGDMVKGISNHTQLLQEIFGNGIRAGEFLGVDSHSDLTPLDTDFSIITASNLGETLEDKISKTNAGCYGSMYVILKNDPARVEFTRSNSEVIQISENTSAEKMSNLATGKELLRRVEVRSNERYETKKLEAFYTGAIGEDHYGVRTGLGITDIDYIVIKEWDKRIAYELAMNGTYIPVYDYKTQEILFTPEMYDEIRDKMQGLAYYDTGEFHIDSSAYSSKVQEIIKELFPDGNSQNSISQKDAQKKRNVIERKVIEVLRGEFGIDVLTYLTGDLTNGFVEFIDTGSTGRGTNLPGDGDFDFTMKIDKAIIDDPEKYKIFKDALRKTLGTKSKDPDSSLGEANGNFRYKKVQLEGLESEIDIDITFMQKNGEIEYSTDMAVRDRLDGLKESDPEGYKATIANIVLAKKMLKEAGLYKKSSSPGASVFGGFGGVGVENWILQNGGSFIKAMETFLEASTKAKSFSEFMEIYPIFDFGQNHMAKGYSHDSFIRGLTEQGYTEMKKKFKEFQEQLMSAVDEEIQKPSKERLTFVQIGKETLDDFRQAPGEVAVAGETIEKGVTNLKELNEANVQGGD